MKSNVSVEKCFQLIDSDQSTTISVDDLKQALIRFNVGLKEKEIKLLLQGIDQSNRGYISKNEFI
jgi:Ca2+-binding EF-hand superfamily protein